MPLELLRAMRGGVLRQHTPSRALAEHTAERRAEELEAYVAELAGARV